MNPLLSEVVSRLGGKSGPPVGSMAAPGTVSNSLAGHMPVRGTAMRPVMPAGGVGGPPVPGPMPVQAQPMPVQGTAMPSYPGNALAGGYPQLPSAASSLVRPYSPALSPGIMNALRMRLGLY